jgi:DNA-binding transcriptional MerR regulator
MNRRDQQVPAGEAVGRIEIHATHYRISLAAESVGMTERQVRQYVQIGLVPSTVLDNEPSLDDLGLARLRKIRRLRQDLGLNVDSVEVVMRLLDQIEQLQQQLDRRL